MFAGVKLWTGGSEVQVDPSSSHDHDVVATGEDPAEHRLRLASSVGVARVDEVHADLECAEDRSLGLFGLDFAVAIAGEPPGAEPELGHDASPSCLEVRFLTGDVRHGIAELAPRRT